MRPTAAASDCMTQSLPAPAGRFSVQSMVAAGSRSAHRLAKAEKNEVFSDKDSRATSAEICPDSRLANAEVK